MMKMHFDLIDLINKQNNIIKQQNEIIINLLNESAEQESLISELLR